MKRLSFQSAFFGVAVFSLFLMACSGQSKEDDPAPVSSNPWLIQEDKVVRGGPGKDGIPSVDYPRFSYINSIDFLNPGDLVLGVKVGDEIRAYPHVILDWHEIVNDDINGLPLAITYCPLTGTGIGWDRRINGATTTFGVSGWLYNSNLIPYDRATGSHWSQMLLKSVNGSLIEEKIRTYPLIETTWQTWKTMFPDSEILNKNSGFNRTYSFYPYGNYKTDHDFLLFPLETDDTRLPRKQRGLGVVVNGSAAFYPFDKFDAPVAVYQDNFRSVPLVIAGSSRQNFLVAYERRLPDGALLQFQAVEKTGNPVIMTDNEGNQWNIFGEAVEGPRKGTALKPTQSFMGYWFAWGAFYLKPEIFK